MKTLPNRITGTSGRSALGLGLAVAILWSPPTRTQRPALPSKAAITGQVESLVRARLADPQGPASISVAIVRRGETLVQQAWGTADVSAKRPATAAMTYRIGSVSKQFTAALILRLVDRGTLSLGDTLDRTLGRHFTNLRPEWRSITVEQLLNHTSGLPREYRLNALLPLGNPTDEARVGWAARDPLMFAPGTRHLYSNTGYMLLGLLVEKLYGKRYGDVMRDEIAGPLGSTTLGPCMAADKRATETMGHARSPQGDLQAASELLADLALGAGGLCATAGDLARWNMALHGGRVLSKASYAAMITPRGAARSEHYGFGIRAFRLPSPVLTHDGATITFASENSWFSAEALSVTVLYNSSPGPATSPMAGQLARIALGHAPPPSPGPPATAPASLRALAGFYEGRPGRGVTVTLNNGTLYAEPTGSQRARLVPQKGTTYYVGREGALVTVTFTLDADGRATALVLREGTRERTFPKVR